jgi:hypothetical protein
MFFKLELKLLTVIVTIIIKSIFRVLAKNIDRNAGRYITDRRNYKDKIEEIKL